MEGWGGRGGGGGRWDDERGGEFRKIRYHYRIVPQHKRCIVVGSGRNQQQGVGGLVRRCDGDQGKRRADREASADCCRFACWRKCWGVGKSGCGATTSVHEDPMWASAPVCANQSQILSLPVSGTLASSMAEDEFRRSQVDSNGPLRINDVWLILEAVNTCLASNIFECYICPVCDSIFHINLRIWRSAEQPALHLNTREARSRESIPTYWRY